MTQEQKEWLESEGFVYQDSSNRFQSRTGLANIYIHLNSIFKPRATIYFYKPKEMDFSFFKEDHEDPLQCCVNIYKKREELFEAINRIANGESLAINPQAS